jgi:LysM repeat protein
MTDEPKHSPIIKQTVEERTTSAPALANSATSLRASFYVIRPGDTLYGIAKLFKVAVQDVMRWNNLNEVSKLVPGHRVRILLAAN